MSKTYLGTSSPWTIVAPAALTGGTALLVGTLLVIPIADAASGAVAAVECEGVHTLPKATGEVWAVGDLVYWDDTAKKITKTSTSNTKVGIASAAAVSGATSGAVRLNGIAV